MKIKKITWVKNEGFKIIVENKTSEWSRSPYSASYYDSKILRGYKNG